MKIRFYFSYVWVAEVRQGTKDMDAGSTTRSRRPLTVNCTQTHIIWLLVDGSLGNFCTSSSCSAFFLQTATFFLKVTPRVTSSFSKLLTDTDVKLTKSFRWGQ